MHTRASHKPGRHTTAMLATFIGACVAACEFIVDFGDPILREDAGGAGGTASSSSSGGGGTGGVASPCATPEDCPAGDDCSTSACPAGKCTVDAQPAGTPCLGGAGLCDGKGKCVACLTNADCAAKDPTTPVCDLSAHECVSCSDGTQNGKETDVDCGGSDCGACVGMLCDPEHGCGNAASCALPENICCATPCGQKCDACASTKTGQPDGTCAPVVLGEDPDGECALLGGCGTAGACRCQDGVKNADETDVDCGGPTCAGCGGGKQCLTEADCAQDAPACVSYGTGSICCESSCKTPCHACNSQGLCADVTGGQSDPWCASTEACGLNGAGCVGKFGAGCASKLDCLSDDCQGPTGNMTCQKGAAGKPCNSGTDCLSGTCTGYLCQ